MLRLRILGSGDAFNGSGALHSCYLLEHAAGVLMLECGPSVLAAMKRAKLATGLPDAILISHLHGDHFGGIPFLFLEYMFQSQRTRPLRIVGPPTIERRINDLYRALYKDIVECRQPSFDIQYVEIHPGSQLELAGLAIDAFEVPHSATPFSLGYRLSGGGATVLFSGDSAWTDEFIPRSRGADVFICECCSLERVANVHTSYADILAHRAALGCRRLLLTHLGADVRESKAVAVERAYDGMVVELGT